MGIVESGIREWIDAGHGVVTHAPDRGYEQRLLDARSDSPDAERPERVVDGGPARLFVDTDRRPPHP